MSDSPPMKPNQQEIAEVALRAFEESLLMSADHVVSGILPVGAARVFAMIDAIQAVDDIRADKAPTIHISENDPRWGN